MWKIGWGEEFRLSLIYFIVRKWHKESQNQVNGDYWLYNSAKFKIQILFLNTKKHFPLREGTRVTECRERERENTRKK